MPLLLFSPRTDADTCVPRPLTTTPGPKLTATDGAANDGFGNSVSISGDTMVVGASGDDGVRGSAYILVRIAGTWTQMAKLTASDGASSDSFGASVSLSGDTVVVGAYGDDVGVNGDQGSAYVFVKPGGGWSNMTQTAKLTASDGAANDFFGDSVAVSGDTVVVGALRDDIGANVDQGTAYVFVKPGPGWTNMTQTAKLTASDGAADDFFGLVAVSGNTVVVGANQDDASRGSAYVFVKPGGGWSDMTQTAKLTASDGASSDSFGNSVAFSGDTVAVGAWSDRIGPNNGQGSAYVFIKPGGGWSDMTQTAKLTASDGAADDLFGARVAVSGDTVVAVAVFDDIGPNSDQGSAYVFVKPRGGWCDLTESTKLTAADGATNDFLGSSAAISGDTVVVGAHQDAIGPNVNQGSAYVYTIDCTTSPLAASAGDKLIAVDGAALDEFGVLVSVSGDTMVVGAYFDDGHRGSAYVFVRSAGTWTQRAKLTASDGAADDRFGTSVAVSGDTVVAGAFNNIGQGSAYVFVKPAGGWSDMTQTAKLTASDGATEDYFGSSVAVSGDTVVVGALGDDIGPNTNQGSAYVFVKPGGGWANMTQTAKLTASDGAADDLLGYSVGVSVDSAVVGARLDDIGPNIDQGSAYVFVKPGGGWADMTQTAKLTASDGAANDGLGISVAVSGNTVIVGAWLDDIGPNTDQGSAYVFVKPGGGWADMTQTAKLTASDGAADDLLGYSVGVSGDTVVVGANYDDLGPNTNQGSAYVFVKPGGGWCDLTESAKVIASDGASSDFFGYSVAVSGDTVVVGAQYDDIGAAVDQGSAYVFNVGIVFVDEAATGANNGTSWTNAYSKLQDALAYATIHPEVTQIWVATGTYEPDLGVGITPGDRSATFQLISGLALYGGFGGFETTLNQRNPIVTLTTLSGDLNENDSLVPCSQNSPDCDVNGRLCDGGSCITRNNIGENSFFVVTADASVNSSTVLDGFVIRGGNTTGGPLNNEAGGGLRIVGGSPSVANCEFRNNKAAGNSANGAGVFHDGGSPSFTDCLFRGNSANSYGGGLRTQNGTVLLDNCRFESNTAGAGAGGGAIFAQSSNATVSACQFLNNTGGSGGASLQHRGTINWYGCLFVGNSGVNSGGAIHMDTIGGAGATSSLFANCAFTGNTSSNGYGGALYAQSSFAPGSTDVTVINCTFTANTAVLRTEGGAVHNGFSGSEGTVTMANSVLWGNTALGATNQDAQIRLVGVASSVDYSTIQDLTGSLGGMGNLSGNPLFVDSDGADNVAGTEDDNLRLTSASPCIDAGDTTALPLDTLDLDGDGNTTERISHDLAGNPRILDDPATANTGVGSPTVDIGAYEFFTDCNDDDVPDICNRSCGAANDPCFLFGCGGSNDCNINNVLDQCDIANCPRGRCIGGSNNGGLCTTNAQCPGGVCGNPDCDDCNLNHIPDECDIAGGFSLDVLPSGMPDGIPDECTIFVSGGANNNWNTPGNWTNNTVPNNTGPNVFSVTINTGNTVLLNIPAEVDSLRLLDAGTLNVTGAVNENLTLAAAGGVLIRGNISTNAPSSMLVGNNRLIDASAGAVTLAPAGKYAKSPTVPVTNACLTCNSVRIEQGVCACGPQVHVDGGSMELTGGMRTSVTGDLVLAGTGGCLPCPSGFRGITPPPKLCVTGGNASRAAAFTPHATDGALPPGAPGLNSGSGSGERMLDCTGSTADLTIGGSLIMQYPHATFGTSGCAFTDRPPETKARRHQGTEARSQAVMAQILLGGDLVLKGTGDIDWLNAKVTLNGPPVPGQFFEVASGDVGPADAGFTGSFALGEMELLANRNVFLIDQFDNDPVESGPEVLYVNTLTLGPGSVLTVRNCALYYRGLINNGGTIVVEGFGRSSPLVNPPSAVTIGQQACRKNRYVSFVPNNGLGSVAFKIDKVTAPTGTAWVGTPDANGVASVVPAPVIRVWTEAVIHVGDCEIVPAAAYEIRTTADGGSSFSAALTVNTIAAPAPKFFGDTTGGLVAGAWNCPNGVVNANDFQMALQKFLGAATAPHNTMSNIQAVSSTDPCLNSVTNIADVFLIIKAFQGLTYPFTTNPASCPPCP